MGGVRMRKSMKMLGERVVMMRMMMMMVMRCVWVAPLSAEGRSGGWVWCVVGKAQRVGVFKG